MSLMFVLSAALRADSILLIALVIANEVNDVIGASAGEIASSTRSFSSAFDLAFTMYDHQRSMS
jgi:hypothetical protein